MALAGWLFRDGVALIGPVCFSLKGLQALGLEKKEEKKKKKARQ